VLLPREGTDVMVALDVSASMLAPDVPPSRFEHAKVLIGQLLYVLHGDRVGLTVFAGNAILRFPLTTDVEAARELINSTAIRDGNLRPGTGIGEALKVAGGAFGPDSARSKLIVLISDGEDLAGDPLPATQTPREQGAVVYTIGLGTEEGSALPAATTAAGRSQPRLDPATGQPAVSRANEALLRQIASAGGGRFFNGNGDAAIPTLTAEIAGLQRTKFQSQEGSLPVERYQWFVGAALALLLLESVLPERRRGRGGAVVRPAERREAA
jgi:Ca-activated chloride channel family protein